VDAQLRSRVNLSYVAAAEDPRLAYRVAREGVELVRHLGIHGWPYILSNAAQTGIRIGDWDWIEPAVEEAAQTDTHIAARLRLAEIRGLRGSDVDVELQDIADLVADLTEAQAQSSVGEVRASVALARGDTAGALQAAQEAYRHNVAPDTTAHGTAARAAAWLGDATSVREALGVLEELPGRVNDATSREARAALAVLDGRRDDGHAGFLDAVRRWQDLGLEFEAAVCALSLVTMLGPISPEAQAAAEWAGAMFERVGAEPFVRLLADAMQTPTPAAVVRRDSPVASDPRASATRAE
jgi:hypothetical protein